MDKTGASPGKFPWNAGGGTGQHGTGSRVDYSITTKERFLLWEKASRDTLELKRIYVDITDDLITGLLLSQIIYWHLPSKEQLSKLTIERDGKHWLAKSRDEWWDECRISPKQYDRAITILEKTGLVDTATYKFKGNPTKHISLNWENFLYLFEQKLTEQAIDESEIIPIPQKECPPIQDSSVIDQRVKTIFPKGQKGISPKDKNDFSQRSRTNLSSSSQELLPTQDPSVFDQRIKTNLPKGEEGIFPRGNLDLDERVRTYIRNTETTAEITADNIKNIHDKFEKPSHNENHPASFEQVSDETFSSSFAKNNETENETLKDATESSGIKKIDQPSDGIKKGGEKNDNPKPLNDVHCPVKTLRERYSKEELHVIDCAIDAFASTRKTYQVSDQIILNQYKKWQQYPASQVIEGLTIYLEKDCAAEGKAEDYALGIIRMHSKQKNLQKQKEGKNYEAESATGSKNFGWEEDKKYGDMYIIPDMS